ncbi:MAG: alkaline phosphatase family protein [Stenotrophobium sp.]
MLKILKQLTPLGIATAFMLLLANCGTGNALSGTAGATPATRIGHVFIIVLENEDYGNSFAANSPAPYLATTLPAQGALLQNYYGTGHLSNDNYISMISGQGPNALNQTDCQIYADFIGSGPQTMVNGQAVGQGCVFPASVPTVVDQLGAAGYTWKAYMEDMGNTPSREAATCGHPALNSQDGTQSATAADQYATRHNPFVYFHSIIDKPVCDTSVVNLKALDGDLQSTATTPNYSFITPNLCHDGHDAPCADGEPGGLVSANTFLSEWVPKIVNSPAFRQDGLLIITFDESSGPQSDASACCGEGPAANAPLPGLAGLGGGKIGALLLSPFIKPGTVSTPYNHYSMLRSVEDIFGLQYLGYASTAGQASFGTDVFTVKMPVFPAKH